MEKYDKKEINGITIYSKENGDTIEIKGDNVQFYNIDGKGNMSHSLKTVERILNHEKQRQEEKGLNLFNFLKKANSGKLNDFVDVICDEVEEPTILNVCRYILEHEREWDEVVKDICPFLREYSLAYEDTDILDPEGEDFVVNVIWYKVQYL